jgi:hypothetical protein
MRRRANVMNGPAFGCRPQKEAVRASERPKSREETPVLGYGSEEVLLRYRNFCMRLFAFPGNARLDKGQYFK